LYTYEKGLAAFCFEVDEVRPKKQKTLSKKDKASEKNS